MSLAGGVPILLNGHVIGALGISGGTSTQDEEVATAAIGKSAK
ncbi:MULTISPECIES: heme-binding protein [unclassified Sphingobium]